MDTWTMIECERRELADLAESLTDEQMDVQSLCDAWRVRHVIGHVLAVATTSKLATIAGVLRNGFNVDRYLAREGVREGERSRADLVADLRDHVSDRALPPMIKAEGILADTLVHAQDVRRPLGMPREIPSERIRLALDTEKGNAIMGIKRRVAGLRLVATDMDWSHGDGPEVEGTGEAILMAILGRRVAIDDLSGEGVATLASRK